MIGKHTLNKLYKKILQHRYVVIFFMIGLLCVADTISYRINPHSSIFVHIVKKSYFNAVLNKSQDFYDAYERPLQTDEFILLAWLWPEKSLRAQREFNDDPFDRFYSDALKNDTLVVTRKVDRVEELEAFTRIFGENAFVYDVGKWYEKNLTDSADDVLVKALYCDKFGWDDFDYYLLERIKDDNGGYGDTHYLLGLLFLEKLECDTKENIDQHKNAVIKKIVSAQEKDDVFSDLFAERAVVLYWAGVGDKVKYAWIKKIAKNNQSDGGWKDVSADQTDAHATGLSALAIKYFIEGKSLQDVLMQ